MDKPVTQKGAIVLVSYPVQQNPVLMKELEALEESGWRITVVAWHRKGRYPGRYGKTLIDPIHIQGRFGQAGVGVAFQVIRFWVAAVLKLVGHSNRYTIIQCQDLNTLLPGIVVSVFLKKKLIFDCHDPYPEMIATTHSRALVRAAQWMEKRMCRAVDAVITVNQAMRKRFEGICAKPIFVVYNYPEAARFVPERERRRKRPEIVIGRIGSIQEAVGIEETVSAFRECLKGHPVTLLFVGRISDSFRERFAEMIRPLGPSVEIHEDVPFEKIPGFYRKMDISMVLYPEHGIAPFISPMKLFESMAMGVPVIASDIGEIRRTVERCRCGIVIPQNTNALILRALRSLIGSRKKRTAFGQNGARAIRDGMNWETEKSRFVGAFERVHGWSTSP